MSAYLKYFQLERSPFDTAEQSNLVLGTRAIRDAFQQIKDGLSEDAARICVNGGTGMGKTSLARALPKLLSEQARTAVWSNTSLDWSNLRASIVKQLGLNEGGLSRSGLIAARQDKQRLVLVIDAAEQLEQETLDHLDILLGYRDDADRQLVHCVMLLNLDNTRGGESPIVWWLDKLTTLQLEFASLPANGIASYIHKHLERAGRSDDAPLFSQDAALAIHRMTGGVPRAVGELCERLLAEAADRGLEQIGVREVEAISGEPASRPHESKPADRADGSEGDDSEAAATERDSDESSNPSAPSLDSYFGTPMPESGESAHRSTEMREPSTQTPIPQASGRAARYVVAAVVGVAIVAASFFALRDGGGDGATELEPTAAVPAAEPAEVADAGTAIETASDATPGEGDGVALEGAGPVDESPQAQSMLDELSPSDTDIDPLADAAPVVPERAAVEELSIASLSQASALQHATAAAAPVSKLRRAGLRPRPAKPQSATRTPGPAALAPAPEPKTKPETKPKTKPEPEPSVEPQ
jgi:type II secretory pathway predicted ATPase ExeA